MCSKGAGERMAIPLNQFRQELYDSYQRVARDAMEEQRALTLRNFYGYRQGPSGLIEGGLAQTFKAPTVEIDYASDSVVIMGKRITRLELEQMGPDTVAAQLADNLRRGEMAQTEELRALQKKALEQLDVLMSGEPKDHLAERFDGLIFDEKKDK